MGSKSTGSSLRAQAKRAKRNERDKVLKPYDEVKFMIDGLINGLDRGKVQIQRFIEETKAEEKNTKEAGLEAGPLCPGCGTEIDTKDKFCRSCGHKL